MIATSSSRFSKRVWTKKRILDEVKALSAIRSKHVVQIYDVVKDGSGAVTALVEEFLPGQDLNDILPIKDAGTFLRHVYAIACGLADIHAVGVVHRDIKPNNMKIDAEGVSDFRFRAVPHGRRELRDDWDDRKLEATLPQNFVLQRMRRSALRLRWMSLPSVRRRSNWFVANCPAACARSHPIYQSPMQTSPSKPSPFRPLSPQS